MMHQRKFVRALAPVDVLIIFFLFLLGTYSIIRSEIVHDWISLIAANVFGSVIIILLASLALPPGKKIFRFLHDWYPIPTIFFVFKEVYVILQSLGLKDWDDILIACDRYIFHVDPTVWLAQYSSPVITELLQIAYVSYYMLMLTLGVELYFRRDRKKFSYAVFTVTYGFLLSYIGYLFFPAVGPRFTLHAFGDLNFELPGIFVTNALRDFVNSGESIPLHVANPIAFAQRDAFPSGHTQMTLIVMYFAYQYRLRSRWWLYIFGSLLIISTVYLRYHYVTDLIGGAVFMIATVWSAPKLISWWNTRTDSTAV